VSDKFANIRSPTSAHYYASILFTCLCTRGISLATLAPHSPWSKKRVEQWDFSSLAGLTRSILELRLTFFYLCSERCSPEEWECRWNIFNIHDCNSRIHLFEKMHNEESEVAGFKVQIEELRSRLTTNAFFINLAEKEKNQYLKGNKAYLHTLEDIASRANIERESFRLIYQILSSHAHGYPFSFYRVGEQNRGRGIHSEIEEGYTINFCLEWVTNLLNNASNEMEQLFTEETNDC
jgi:hypothetical protein